MPVDTALVGALHVDYLKKRNLAGDQHAHHTLFQTSTIDALLEGKYDGDVSFAELEKRGDLGLGTLDALDGEMIALGGNFYQVKADGRAYVIDKRQRTPFAVMPTFESHHVLGSLVGFRFPRYAQGLNVAGYHFHFITADRSAGGHVLKFQLARGELHIDREADLQLELPSGVGLPVHDSTTAKGEVLDRIERQ